MGRHGRSGEKQVDSGMTRFDRLDVGCERGVKDDSKAWGLSNRRWKVHLMGWKEL